MLQRNAEAFALSLFAVFFIHAAAVPSQKAFRADDSVGESPADGAEQLLPRTSAKTTSPGVQTTSDSEVALRERAEKAEKAVKTLQRRLKDAQANLGMLSHSILLRREEASADASLVASSPSRNTNDNEHERTTAAYSTGHGDHTGEKQWIDPCEEVYHMKLRIEGINYNRLMAMPEMRYSFKEMIKKAIILGSGNNITRNRVEVLLSAKQPVLATIKNFRLETHQFEPSTSLTSSIATSLAGLDIIQVVQNGSISVTSAESEAAASSKAALLKQCVQEKASSNVVKVVSNAAYFMPAILAFRLSLYFDFTLWLSNGLISGAYHWCDRERKYDKRAQNSIWSGVGSAFCEKHDFFLHRLDHVLPIYLFWRCAIMVGQAVTYDEDGQCQSIVYKVVTAMFLLSVAFSDVLFERRIGTSIIYVGTTWILQTFVHPNHTVARLGKPSPVLFWSFWRSRIRQAACLLFFLFFILLWPQDRLQHAWMNSMWHVVTAAWGSVCLWQFATSDSALDARVLLEYSMWQPVFHWVFAGVPLFGFAGIAAIIFSFNYGRPWEWETICAMGVQERGKLLEKGLVSACLCDLCCWVLVYQMRRRNPGSGWTCKVASVIGFISAILMGMMSIIREDIDMKAHVHVAMGYFVTQVLALVLMTIDEHVNEEPLETRAVAKRARTVIVSLATLTAYNFMVLYVLVNIYKYRSFLKFYVLSEWITCALILIYPLTYFCECRAWIAAQAEGMGKDFSSMDDH